MDIIYCRFLTNTCINRSHFLFLSKKMFHFFIKFLITILRSLGQYLKKKIIFVLASNLALFLHQSLQRQRGQSVHCLMYSFISLFGERMSTVSILKVNHKKKMVQDRNPLLKINEHENDDCVLLDKYDEPHLLLSLFEKHTRSSMISPLLLHETSFESYK